MRRLAILSCVLCLAAAAAVPAADGKATVVTLIGKEYAPLWTPQITEVDRVREGKWGGAMWCPISGTSVKLIGDTGPACGMADIYIDGIFRKSVDWYSEQKTGDVVLFSAEGLSDGKHLLGVLTREAKRPESAGTAVHWSRVEYVAGEHPERFAPVRRTRAPAPPGGRRRATRRRP